MLVIAIGFTTIGAWKLYKPLNYIVNGLTTKAKVIHVDRDAFWSNDSNKWISTYHPTVRFYWYQKAYDAKVIMAGNQYENVHKGNTVEVRFLPDNPYVATPKWPLPQLIANGLFLLVGLIVFWMIYKEHRYKEPEFPDDILEEPINLSLLDQITHKHYAANITKGVFIFRLALLLAVIYLAGLITYLIATDQTVDKIPIAFYPIIFITFAVGIYALTKSSFYHLTVTIDKTNREIRVLRKLFWSKRHITLMFGDIQYIQASAKKFFYKDSGYHLTSGSSDRLGDTKTYYFFVYIKPYEKAPILLEKVNSIDKANELTKEYAEIIGCRTLTLGDKRIYSR